MGFLANFPVWAAAPVAGGVAVVAVAGGLAWKAATGSSAPVAQASAAAPATATKSAPLPPEAMAAAPPASVQDSGSARPLPPQVAKLESASPLAAPKALPEPNAVILPTFDVVRAEPSGDVLVAGRGVPGAKVAVTEDARVLASGVIDSAGQFVLLPPSLKPGGHLLGLQMTIMGSAPLNSAQSVAVSIAEPSAGGVLVALAEPGKATDILSDPPAVLPPLVKKQAANPEIAVKPAVAPLPGSFTSLPMPEAPAPSAPPPVTLPAPLATLPALAAPAAAPEISIRTVEIEQGGGFFASGLAAAGANVRLYLNGTYVAALQVNALGRWSLTITRGMLPGRYAVRADQIETASGNVTARAEVPFDYPAVAVIAPPGPPLPVARPVDLTISKPSAAAAADPADLQNQVSAREPAVTPQIAPSLPVSADAAAGEGGLSKTVPMPPSSPAALALPLPGAAPPSPPAKSGADVVIKEIQTTTVVRGDSLWRISRQSLGQGVRYTQIYEANAGQIRNPSLIYIGQVLVLPPAP